MNKFKSIFVNLSPLKGSNSKSEFIKIRVTWPQNAYIKDVPLHHSQRVIQETEDYSDFELFISPTFDFIQGLLTHRETLTVLSPQTFKEEMIDVLKICSPTINN